VPPLRERKNDIPILVDHFLIQIAERYGNKKLNISADAVSALMGYK